MIMAAATKATTIIEMEEIKRMIPLDFFENK
jgi:hypothetical protein